MSALRRMNSALGKKIGFEIKRANQAVHEKPKAKPAAAGKKEPEGYRPPADPVVDRLLTAPVFVMSPVRSGSTLLRMLLDGHSYLHAPHELHIRRLTVDYATKLAATSMDALGLDRGDLEHLLWDRVMHRELIKSGKSCVVEKTPGNAFAWQRISTCWPDSRFIFLLRHPASIAQSWHEAHPDWGFDRAAADALRYMKATERARTGLSGLTVRYEDPTRPTAALRRRRPRGPAGHLYGLGLPPSGGRRMRAHAELESVWPRDDVIRLVGHVHGRMVPDDAGAWRLLFVLRDREHIRVGYDVALDGTRFDAAVPIGDLVPPGPSAAGPPPEAGTVAEPTEKWDIHLVDPTTDTKESWLRMGRRLDDTRNKKKIMVYPAQEAADDTGTVVVRPFYTIYDNLSIECCRCRAAERL
jgi:Sulfotransferase family